MPGHAFKGEGSHIQMASQTICPYYHTCQCFCPGLGKSLMSFVFSVTCRPVGSPSVCAALIPPDGGGEVLTLFSGRSMSWTTWLNLEMDKHCE